MSKKVEEELYILLRLKFFNSEDIKVLKMWASFVEEHGPEALELLQLEESFTKSERRR